MTETTYIPVWRWVVLGIVIGISTEDVVQFSWHHFEYRQIVGMIGMFVGALGLVFSGRRAIS